MRKPRLPMTSERVPVRKGFADEPRPGRLMWKLNAVDVRIASVRYRALKPISLLIEAGWDCDVREGRATVDLDGVTALINVKSYSFHDLGLVQQAARLGVPVILDLCDNIFLETYRSEKTIEPVRVFREMCKTATAITTTSETLANIIRNELQTNIPVVCIPDGIESPDDLRAMLQLERAGSRLPMREALAVMERKGRRRFAMEFPGMLARYAARKAEHVRQRAAIATRSTPASHKRGGQTKTVLWFGNHGALHANFGMLDLRVVRPALEQLAREIDVELLVISNSEQKFNDHIAIFDLPTRYLEWDPIAIYDQIISADVVVLPNNKEPFSLCKSANRAVLALSLGVPVVATRTPVYAPLDECVLFDDWYANIRAYLTDTALVERHLSRAGTALDSVYSDDAILEDWRGVLSSIPAAVPAPVHKGALGYFIGLVGDLEVLQPLMEQTQLTRQIVLFVDALLVEQYPHVWNLLPDVPRWLVQRENIAALHEHIGALECLVSATESNLRPHKLAHEITNLANSLGVHTATLQHGFENIGLTYSDEFQPIEQVRFASKRILTWGGPDTYHPKIHPGNRAKCIPIGFPKNISAPPTEAQPISPYSVNVGIFENLHWTRYSDAYRSAFLHALNAVARARPDLGFVVRPHQSGMWLTNRYQGDVPTAANIIVLSPATPEWKHLTARQMFPALSAIITSPSTVAIDAAVAGIPIAIAGFGMDLGNYEPLEILHDTSDWISFVARATETSAASSSQDAFKRRVFWPGDPFENFMKAIDPNAAPIHVQTSAETMRVFVGSDRTQAFAVRVLEHSIKRHTRDPVEVIPMVDLPVREPKDPRQGQRTGFSFSRFCIPKLCGYAGKAIYMDADMLVFGDLAELWNIPFDGAKVVIQQEIKHQDTSTDKVGAPTKRQKQCAVMLIDCSRVDWDIDRIVDGLDEQRYTYEELMNDLCILDERDVKYGVPFEWNSLEHLDSSTRLIHYTDMYTQPWVSPLNRNSDVWLNEVRLMLEDGTIQWRDIIEEVRLGHFRPTLLRDLRHRHKLPKLIRPLLNRWNLVTDLRAGFEKHKSVYEAKRRRNKLIKAYEAAKLSNDAVQ
jgi:hypothetical protein